MLSTLFLMIVSATGGAFGALWLLKRGKLRFLTMLPQPPA